MNKNLLISGLIKFILFFGSLIFFINMVNGQIIYVTDNRYEADYQVCVTNNRYEADWIVYLTNKKYEAVLKK